ncbi:MAG: efflux RND transporter periplasmic adaptor subunit [Burkholderiales bacterium]
MTTFAEPKLLRIALALSLAINGAAFAVEPATLIPWSSSLDAGTGVIVVPVKPDAASTNGIALQGTAVLPAQQSEMVSMPVIGIVQSVLVSPMEKVRVGQPVARITSPQLVEWQREWLTAQAQARLSQGKAQRDEQLFAEGIVSEQRRNESRAAHEMAALTARERRQALRMAGMSEASLAQATMSSALSPQLTLLAPVAGFVMEQSVVPGQRLEAGSPVTRIGRAGRLAIELQASSQQVQTLRVGDTLMVDGCKSPARISAIPAQVNSLTQSVLVRADLSTQEDCLRVGQFVLAYPQSRTAGASASTAVFSVPSSAMFQHGGQTYVFVRDPKGFRPVVVKTNGGGGADTSVTFGLKAGDEVAVRGVAAIKGAWLGLGPVVAPASAAGGKR